MCSICGEEGGSLVVLPCGHAFHGPCIDRWLRSGVASCPNCRAFVPPMDALEQITQLVHTPRHPCAASHWISASEAYRTRIYEFAFQCVADARRVRKSKRLRLPPDRRDMVRIYCAILFFRARRRQRGVHRGWPPGGGSRLQRRGCCSLHAACAVPLPAGSSRR